MTNSPQDEIHEAFVEQFARSEQQIRALVRSLLPPWANVDDVMQDVLGTVAEGRLYRLVGKLTLSEADEEQFEATMPDETENMGEPLIWPVSLTLRSKERMKYDHVSLHDSGASIYRFDDIRFGNSWEAVTSRNLP